MLARRGGIPWAGAFGIVEFSDMWTRRILDVNDDDGNVHTEPISCMLSRLHKAIYYVPCVSCL